jgi:hypothetical protein
LYFIKFENISFATNSWFFNKRGLNPDGVPDQRTLDSLDEMGLFYEFYAIRAKNATLISGGDYIRKGAGRS